MLKSIDVVKFASIFVNVNNETIVSHFYVSYNNLSQLCSFSYAIHKPNASSTTFVVSYVWLLSQIQRDINHVPCTLLR